MLKTLIALALAAAPGLAFAKSGCPGNFLGIPREGYGLSNDARGIVGAAMFVAASFPYDARDLSLTIALEY